VDCAEAIGPASRTLAGPCLRLLVQKRRRMRSTNISIPRVQAEPAGAACAPAKLLELVEEMSPPDEPGLRLFDELPAKVVAPLLMQLSPAEAARHRQTSGL